MIRENCTIVKESWHMVGWGDSMDFAIVDKALRIKTKTATLFIDPENGRKTEADAALFSYPKDNVSDARLSVTGPGEYEVAGAKISAHLLGKSLYFQIEADNLKIGVGKMSEVAENQDKVPSSNIATVDLDAPINLGSIIAGGPSAIVLYGQNSQEVKDAEKINKYLVTAEKLPQETQTVVIG